MRSLATAAMLLALSACGEGQRMDGDEILTNSTTSSAPLAGQAGVVGAMDAIPEARKGLFQRALACEVKRNAAAGKAALEITAAYLTDLDQRLQKDEKLATC